MKKSEFVLRSFLNALGVLAYAALVAWLMSHGEAIFHNDRGIIVPLFMLLTLIISASVTGLLVLGKPIALYLAELKKEALILFFATLAWLAGFVAIIISIALLLNRA